MNPAKMSSSQDSASVFSDSRGRAALEGGRDPLPPTQEGGGRVPDPAEFPYYGSWFEKLVFLIRIAVLAPSSHNSQPWRFHVEDHRIDLLVDESRRLPVADPDGRELYLSLGCALENLLVAAERFDLAYVYELIPNSDEPSLAARVWFGTVGEPTPFRDRRLYDVVGDRHTHHGSFEDRPIPNDLMETWKRMVVEPGIDLWLIESRRLRERLSLLAERADQAEFADPEFRHELANAVGRGDLGDSWPMNWIGQWVIRHFDLGGSVGRKEAALIQSAPLLGLITAKTNHRVNQLRAGMVFERIALTATLSGVRLQPISSILEVAVTRDELADLSPDPEMVPLHLFRLGFAEPEQRESPRRPLEDVLI